jgi:uncharacterized protein (DUF58 family)
MPAWYCWPRRHSPRSPCCPARPAELPLVTVAVSGARCFEGEDVTLTATVSCPAATEIDIRFVPAPTVSAVPVVPGQWRIKAEHWGRYSPGTVLVNCAAGAWHAAVAVEVEPLEVFPRAARTRPRLVPAELLRRIGEHTGRATGDGVEFAGIRPYASGDQLRDLNRAVSIRRQGLYVNQRAASRAADLVVVIDSLTETGPPGETTLDIAAHGAAALAAAYLRVSDRVGVVVLGGVLRWLAPAAGDRQFYRIAEMMLRARYDAYVDPDLARIPRIVLPPRALVVLFSPLADAGALTAITDLRQRGLPVIVVDTLRYEPGLPAHGRRRWGGRGWGLSGGGWGLGGGGWGLGGRSRAGAAAALALRAWRLERAATRARLAAMGVPVLHWARDAELDGVLAAASSRRIPVRS